MLSQPFLKSYCRCLENLDKSFKRLVAPSSLREAVCIKILDKAGAPILAPATRDTTPWFSQLKLRIFFERLQGWVLGYVSLRTSTYTDASLLMPTLLMRFHAFLSTKRGFKTPGFVHACDAFSHRELRSTPVERNSYFKTFQTSVSVPPSTQLTPSPHPRHSSFPPPNDSTVYSPPSAAPAPPSPASAPHVLY